MGCWLTLSTGSRCNVALPSNRLIDGSWRPTSDRICSRRRLTDSQSCPVVVRPPYGPSTPTPYCHTGECPRKRRWTWGGLCNWGPLPFCRVYFMSEEVWDLVWTLLSYPPPQYLQLWDVPTRHFSAQCVVWSGSLVKALEAFSSPKEWF